MRAHDESQSRRAHLAIIEHGANGVSTRVADSFDERVA